MRRKELGNAIKELIKTNIRNRTWTMNFVMREFGLSYPKLLSIIDDGEQITPYEMRIVQDILNDIPRIEILLKYNINEYTLDKITVRHKVKFKRKDTIENKERDGKIIKMAKEGKTIPEINAEMNMNRQRIKQILDREGVVANKANRKRKRI